MSIALTSSRNSTHTDLLQLAEICGYIVWNKRYNQNLYWMSMSFPYMTKNYNEGVHWLPNVVIIFSMIFNRDLQYFYTSSAEIYIHTLKNIRIRLEEN